MNDDMFAAWVTKPKIIADQLDVSWKKSIAVAKTYN